MLTDVFLILLGNDDSVCLDISSLMTVPYILGLFKCHLGSSFSIFQRLKQLMIFANHPTQLTSIWKKKDIIKVNCYE